MTDEGVGMKRFSDFGTMRNEETYVLTPSFQNAVPTVVETNEKGRKEEYNIYSLLLRKRIIFLGTAIDDQVANSVVAQLLYLDSEDPESDILMYINSPGGIIYSGLAIYDAMQLINADVRTYCVGAARSMGTVLLTAGAKGKRYALPSSTIHMHQPLGGAQGQATDVEIHAREILRLKDQLREIIAETTGQPYDRVTRDSDRDFYLTAEEAKEYGLVDEIVSTMPIP